MSGPGGLVHVREGAFVAEGDGVLRVRLDLGYDGTDFAGWAVQPGQRTVLGVLMAALATLLRLPPEQVEVVVAGRTDSGVHATGQVCHVEVPAGAWAKLPGRSTLAPTASMLRRLAGVLPPDLRVHAVAPAPDGFDARFSAIWRRYTYRLCDHPAGVPPLRRHEVVPYPRPLDEAAMDDSARRLLGLHDFAAFCRRREGATTIRTLLQYGWTRDADGLVVASVVADAFCHSMVRSLVGAALAVGEGRKDAGWPARVLAAGVRDSAVSVAAPRGLVLSEVGYPPDDQLAHRASQARVRRVLPERS